jgi:hypothetical protein
MNAGQVAGFLWDLAAWFFILSLVVLPLSYAAWRKREARRAAGTEETLQSLGFDTSHQHEMDAMQ